MARRGVIFSSLVLEMQIGVSVAEKGVSVFSQLGQVVFQNEDLTVYKVNPA